LGLALFAGIATRRSISLLRFAGNAPKTAHLQLVVFLAVIAATLVESLTHQIFRTRELWLVLAIQEAVYFYLKTSESGVELPIPTMNKPSHFHRKSLLRPKVTNGW
jgi:hypothetical protein